MTKKSIVLISNLYPNCNESTRGLFIKQLAESIAKTTVLTVIAPLPYNPLELFGKTSRVPSVELINGITVYHPRYVVIPKLFRSLTGYFFYFGIKKLVRKLVSENKADIISSHWVYPDSFAATLVAKKFNLPIAVHALGCDINEYVKYKLRKRLIVKTLKYSNINIVKSQDLKDKISTLGIPSTKTHVVHNGVDQNKFRRIPSLQARSQLGLSSDLKYGLFVGNFQIEKGLQYLIEAVSYLKDLNFTLLVIGSGPLEQTIKALVSYLNIEDKVVFLGRIEHQKIPLYMAAADILCLPSLREGCPNVVLESLSCGTPVVASNVGAVPDIISSEKFGFIVPPRDPKLLSEGIIKGLELDKEKMPLFEWYSWDKNSNKVLQLLNSID